jgi:hypothetical protein
MEQKKPPLHKRKLSLETTREAAKGELTNAERTKS